MANPVTLTTLITRVRQRANVEGFTLSIPDTEITDALNVSLANEVYNLVRQAVGDKYYEKNITFTTSNGTNIYSLSSIGASDLVALVSVDAYLSANVTAAAPRLNCRRYMEEERNLYVSLPLGWSIGQWILYSLQGANLRFQPIPDSAYAIGVNYVPTSPVLVAGGDTWDDINGWSELAVLDVAALCLAKAKQFEAAAYFDGRRAALKEQIKAQIPMRNTEPERTHQFGRLQYGDGWEYGGGYG